MKSNKNIYRPHPWHGIDLWFDSKAKVLNTYIEIVPDDTVKYELDKKSGYLRVDRPQKFSNIIPALYGFLPKTYSGEISAAHAEKATGRTGIVGDSDPLDICVLTEKNIKHRDILLSSIPIGGFRMIDHGEIDDKIIAVLKDDAVYGDYRDIIDCPKGILARLQHYFLTYKQIPRANEESRCEIIESYDAKEAMKVIELAEKDYQKKFS